MGCRPRLRVAPPWQVPPLPSTGTCPAGHCQGTQDGWEGSPVPAVSCLRQMAIRYTARSLQTVPMNPSISRTESRAEAGFTLVEIMVVVVILGLLATLVVQNVMGASDTAREKKAQTDVTTIADAVRMYRVNHGRFPDSLEALAEKDEKGRSEIESLSKDPWDHDYILRTGDRPNEFEVLSMGPDGSENTEDDISSKPKKDK